MADVAVEDSVGVDIGHRFSSLYTPGHTSLERYLRVSGEVVVQISISGKFQEKTVFG